ncbi:MAG: hypothetical protein JXP37_05200 [Coriobacteriia bacterium]|nr:hypothetical protein [Coriobacteriia bacterium]
MKKAVLLGALAAVMLFGIVGLAVADPVDYPGSLFAPGRWQADNSADPVEVKATVNPKITLTVNTPDDDQSVNFGSVDPGTYDGKTVTLTVNSNKQFDLTVSETLTGFEDVGGESITLNRGLADTEDVAKGSAIPFTDNYEIVVPWEIDPGVYSAFVTYSVLQD